MEDVCITLSRNEALILFEYVSRVSAQDTELDPAEERVLFDIEATLEKTLVEVLAKDYDVLLANAKAKVLEDYQNLGD